MNKREGDSRVTEQREYPMRPLFPIKPNNNSPPGKIKPENKSIPHNQMGAPTANRFGEPEIEAEVKKQEVIKKEEEEKGKAVDVAVEEAKTINVDLEIVSKKPKLRMSDNKIPEDKKEKQQIESNACEQEKNTKPLFTSTSNREGIDRSTSKVTSEIDLDSIDFKKSIKKPEEPINPKSRVLPPRQEELASRKIVQEIKDEEDVGVTSQVEARVPE